MSLSPAGRRVIGRTQRLPPTTESDQGGREVEVMASRLNDNRVDDDQQGLVRRRVREQRQDAEPDQQRIRYLRSVGLIHTEYAAQSVALP
ncbi:hypothetical protein ACIBBE_26605 [Streptomyces sp. NPDC051644]|uniref:hypothetical protein n=1 Tax=Streptomyces sp. NPDC051644 TaxID=3365666 RepID=UPI003798A0C2